MIKLSKCASQTHSPKSNRENFVPNILLLFWISRFFHIFCASKTFSISFHAEIYFISFLFSLTIEIEILTKWWKFLYLFLLENPSEKKLFVMKNFHQYQFSQFTFFAYNKMEINEVEVTAISMKWTFSLVYLYLYIFISSNVYLLFITSSRL